MEALFSLRMLVLSRRRPELLVFAKSPLSFSGSFTLGLLRIWKDGRIRKGIVALARLPPKSSRSSCARFGAPPLGRERAAGAAFHPARHTPEQLQRRLCAGFDADLQARGRLNLPLAGSAWRRRRGSALRCAPLSLSLSLLRFGTLGRTERTTPSGHGDVTGSRTPFPRAGRETSAKGGRRRRRRDGWAKRLSRWNSGRVYRVKQRSGTDAESVRHLRTFSDLSQVWRPRRSSKPR